MTRFVLTADRTLTSDFRKLPHAPFYACGPSNPKRAAHLNRAVRALFEYLAVPPPTYGGGRLMRAPYGMRKLESALCRRLGRDAVATVSGDHVAHFLDEDTKVVGVATMNPLGLNPLTQIGQYFGGSESFAVREFRTLIRKLKTLRDRRNLAFRLVVGGTGALEFVSLSKDVREEVMRNSGIDHVVYGEVDVTAPMLFQELAEGTCGEVVLMTEFNKRHGVPAFGRVEDLDRAALDSLADAASFG
ncbi:MAG: hypothetical protein HY557_01295 [Euryarchaeota archaeon]|nr:hypothetical protein [Euryarchaeota archaeon]